jgi:hypothetical protein
MLLLVVLLLGSLVGTCWADCCQGLVLECVNFIDGFWINYSCSATAFGYDCRLCGMCVCLCFFSPTHPPSLWANLAA